MSSRNLDHSILADPQPCSLAAGVVVLGQSAPKDVAEAVPSTVPAPRNGNGTEMERKWKSNRNGNQTAASSSWSRALARAVG